MLITQVINLIQKTSLSQIFRIKKFNTDSVKYIRNTMITYCILALREIGFFEALLRDGVVDVNDFSISRSLDINKTVGICNYLYIVRILDKKDQKYSFTSKGKGIIINSIGAFDFYYAYSPLFQNLKSLLTREKIYKKDIFRLGDVVGRATAETSIHIPIPVMKDVIRKYKFSSILDLGCGSADFLLSISSVAEVKCYGVDLSKEAIDFAKLKIKEAKKQDQVQVKVGDILSLDNLKEFKDVNALTCMFVLHEFVYDGIENAINFLKHLKNAFPNKYLIICEFSRSTPEELRGNPTSIAEHHLFHALSEQGILTSDECSKIFQLAGYKIVQEIRYDFAGQIYFILI